jgi:transcription initiation factor TFIIB
MISNKRKISNLCPECGGPIISILERGENVCGQCGLIIDERNVDFSQNGKRSFTNQERKEREQTGSPVSILMPDISLSTVIDRSKINNPDLKRAVKWNTRITWEKRNILIATTELKRIASNLNLPEYVKKEAMRFYLEAFKRKLLRGRSINGMVAASIYLASRQKQIPRTLQEILDQTDVNDKEVRRCYRILVRELKVKTPTTNPIALIPRYIVGLDLDIEIERLSIEILKNYIDNFSISGKDPKGLSAGAIYLACKIKNKNYTQQQIANSIGITEVTLRSRYKEIAKKLNIII